MSFTQTGPVLANNDVTIVYSPMTTITFKRNPSFLSFSTQKYAGTVQRAFGCVINVPDLSATISATRGSGDAWDSRKELGSNQIGISVNKHRENGFKTKYNTPLEVPWDTIAQGETSMAIDMTTGMEDDFHTYVAGLTSLTVTAAGTEFGSGDVPVAAGNGDNGNAGKIAKRVLTTTKDFINSAGLPTANGAELIWEALTFGLTRFQRLNVRSGLQVGGMLPEDDLYMFMPVELFVVLRDYMRDQKLDWDEMNRSLYLSAGLFSNMDFQGSLQNVRILTPTVLPVPAADKAANPWVFYMGYPWATSLHPRPPFRASWGAAENQTEPFSVTNQLCDYGYQLIQQAGLIRFEIGTVAASGVNARPPIKPAEHQTTDGMEALAQAIQALVAKEEAAEAKVAA